MTNEINTDIENVELSIAEARKHIEQMEALDRLRTNADFKLIFEQGYLKDEATRLVLARAEPIMQTQEHQDQLNKLIDGVGYFRQYLNKIYQFGRQSQQAIKADQETLTELMNEVH